MAIQLVVLLRRLVLSSRKKGVKSGSANGAGPQVMDSTEPIAETPDPHWSWWGPQQPLHSQPVQHIFVGEVVANGSHFCNASLRFD
jgi:hypothetical protein